MTHFQTFATFYDAFYEDKDYTAEVAYFSKTIQNYCENQPINLLDIGCSTDKLPQKTIGTLRLFCRRGKSKKPFNAYFRVYEQL